MRDRWLALAAIILGAFIGVFSLSAASATDPGPLTGSGNVSDVSGVLSPSQLSAADARLAELAKDTGADVFVVFVPQFTGAADEKDWVARTADGNGFNDHQYLIGIATEGRMFAMAGPDQGGPISAADRSQVTDAMIPALKNSDWAGSIDAAAAQVQEMLVDGPARAARGWTVFGMILLLAVVVVMIVLLVRRARRRAAEAAERQAQIAELARQASIALVRTDDVVRSSEQEMEYARAQFGDDAIGAFVTALQAARGHLDEAFSLQQKLDDEIPDTDQQKREWYERIVQLCTSSTQTLEERKAEFDELRGLEQDAPAALENVRKLRTAAAAEIDRAEKILAELGSTYSPDAFSSVAGNVDEARSRISFTDAGIQAAQQALDGGRSGDAAVSIRAAEGAVQQATQLEDAVEKAQTDLKAAAERAADLVAELNGDVQAAQALPDPDGRVAQVVTATQQGIQQSQAFLGAPGGNPMAALRVLDAANGSIDAVIKNAREEQQRTDQARKALPGVLQRADAQISAAENYILNRRGGISSTARTRLSQAQANQREAYRVADSDPVRALSLSQLADGLATQALQAAQNDFGDWGGGGGNGDTLGALLGGILIGQAGSHHGGGGIFGGGGGGGGWGGGSSGTSGGFFGGGGGGGFSVGGFGGGGGFSGTSGGHF
jgi:hypothetical protein